MKLENIFIAAAAVSIAAALAACGSSSAADPNSSSAVSSSSVVSSESASAEDASSEEVVEPAEYTITNTTGSAVTELYLYEAGAEDKGVNLVGEDGLADGDEVVLTRLPEDGQEDVVLEFVTEDGTTQTFETLHYEVASVYLLSADAASGATPISFTAPQN